VGSRAREAAEDVERKGWQKRASQALMSSVQAGSDAVLLLRRVVYFLYELRHSDKKK